MEFPHNWDIFEMEQFAAATPRAAGELGMELAMQVRPNGRMLDHYRVTLGGSRILDVSFGMAKLVNLPAAATWNLKLQVWPRDLSIRRNMTTSEWQNLETLIAAKDASVFAADDSVLPPADVLATLGTGEANAAMRFAVVIGSDQHLLLMLQGLPATADFLEGRPTFRG
jgi:hypothetical protein